PDPRSLHSFPTRRSSDLVMLGQLDKKVIAADGKKVEFDGPEVQKALQSLVDFVYRDRVDTRTRPPFPSGVESLATPQLAIKWNRSEEHTSELQSLAYLVC